MAIFALKNVAGWRDKPEIEEEEDDFVLFIDHAAFMRPKEAVNEPKTLTNTGA